MELTSVSVEDIKHQRLEQEEYCIYHIVLANNSFELSQINRQNLDMENCNSISLRRDNPMLHSQLRTYEKSSTNNKFSNVVAETTQKTRSCSVISANLLVETCLGWHLLVRTAIS